MTDSTLTPMLRQYHELKRQHPGTLLFFRLGDFYELFFDDAVTGARELGITLTARHKERGSSVPMCGVPHHAAAGHISRLVRKGFRVAICEQTEDPSKAKKLVRREVVRVVTPGTAIDPQLVDSRESVFLAALCAAGDSYGAAFLDLSTGEFRATEARGGAAWERVRADIESYAPRELLFPASLAPLVKETFAGRDQAPPLATVTSNDAQPAHSVAQAAGSVAQATNSNVVAFPRASPSSTNNTTLSLTPLDDWLWEPISCANVLLEQFGARTLEGYGLTDKTEAVAAAGACLRYARETQREAAAHVNDITYFEPQDTLVIDAVTVRNLELFESQSGAGRVNTLFGVLDETVTGMGARLLRSWLLRPSVRRGEIEARLGAVEEFHGSQVVRDRVRALLKEIADLERLVARVNMNTATPRDLSALCRSLGQVPPIRLSLSDSKASLLEVLRDGADELPDVCKLLSEAISDEPPPTLSEPGTIREGYSAELDELRATSRDAKRTIAALEAREKQRSGIASLRVRFNNVFGYFIEVSKGASARVPADYERRQTLANAERFTTPELKEWERKVLGAEDRIRELETTLFAEVRGRVAAETRRLQSTARALAMLDALSALAETAARRRYRKPQLHDADEIEIVAGRHPVIEALSDAPFVPNDLYMNNSTDRLLIITGPNMGGKCLSGDTLVFTGEGIVPLASLRPAGAPLKQFSPITVGVQSRTRRGVATQFYSSGTQPTLRVGTRFGYEIEGTPEHRVWVRSRRGSEGWKRLGDIRAGDCVAIERKCDLWGEAIDLSGCAADLCSRLADGQHLPEQMSEDLAYLLGLLVGDGTVTYENTFSLTTADEQIADEFCRIVSSLFGYRPRRQGPSSWRVHGKAVRTFLARAGLAHERAFGKHVPESIMRAPKRFARAFLQGLFDTDGWASNEQAKVFLSTSSRRLAREVHLLLLNFGIVSSLRAKRTRRRPAHVVSIYGAEAVRFYEEIGFRLERKQQRSAAASAIRMPNLGVPHLADTLKLVQRRIAATGGKPVALKRNKSVNSIFYTYLPAGRNPSYSKLDELIAYCRENRVPCPELSALRSRSYFYDSVASVEVGETEVFDLNVTPDHSYIAGGFVSHNSTVLRQAALVCLLAQAGSFVPAERARLPILDRIWTRVGASDDLARGRSTFMVEMTETAAILHNATPRSLVLLDEIGRGTATFDGLSIAWAVAEHLHDSPANAAKTLFATHYHELTELAERLPGAQNYQIRVAERDGALVFLYRLERGRASKSYGIEVARLAGLPPAVVERAREVLQRLERYELDVFSDEVGEAAPTVSSPASAAAPTPDAQPAPANGREGDGLGQAARRARRRAIAAQATLFDAANQNVLDDLRAAELEKLSHEELRSLLNDVRKRIV